MKCKLKKFCCSYTHTLTSLIYDDDVRIDKQKNKDKHADSELSWTHIFAEKRRKYQYMIHKMATDSRIFFLAFCRSSYMLSLIIRLKKKEKNYCQRPQRQQDVSRHLQRTTKFGVCYIHPNDRRGKNKGNER